ncbi:helix-turn-helix domain-containing protein [Methylophilus sp. 3sh_L]|uniref:helix-turn-helix domain-containing protein n=1 Tax=Methylophilus sp. 3sh_L TaxID=3377114 RepID=UPI00398E322A
MNLRQAFGMVFARARKSKGLTQEEFESVSPRSYISYIERGSSSPTLEKVHELSKVMNVHPASLVFQAYLEFEKESSPLSLMATITADLREIELFNSNQKISKV